MLPYYTTAMSMGQRVPLLEPDAKMTDNFLLVCSQDSSLDAVIINPVHCYTIQLLYLSGSLVVA